MITSEWTSLLNSIDCETLSQIMSISISISVFIEKLLAIKLLFVFER